MEIAITIENETAFSIVHVAGRIDATTSDGLESTLIELLDQGEKNIILNLAETRYISSAGLRVLIVITKQMYDSGQLCLCNANDNLLEIIEMSGVNAFMNIYDDLSTAKINITNR